VIYLSLNLLKLISILITRECIRLIIKRVLLQNSFAEFMLRINIIEALIFNVNRAEEIFETFKV
jgi:hypothetical protein